MLFSPGACCRLQRSYLAPASDAPDPAVDAYQGESYARPMMNCVTHIRASIMLMTCITILAVDFQASYVCNLQCLIYGIRKAPAVSLCAAGEEHAWKPCGIFGRSHWMLRSMYPQYRCFRVGLRRQKYSVQV